MPRRKAKAKIKSFVVVTGMSGAGKTATLKVLEDFGFTAVDNLPPELLPQLFKLLANKAANQRGVAVTIDIRNAGSSEELLKALDTVEAAGLASVKIVFLTASNEELLRRYEKTRRVQPFITKNINNINNLNSASLSTIDGINQERAILAPVLARANIVLDTSLMDLSQHRGRLLKEFFDNENDEAGGGMSLLISSFGFKYGVPQDSNFVFDVRCLPNPYYVAKLRNLTGEDRPVQDYLLQFPETLRFLGRSRSFLDFAIPEYFSSVKGQLHIAVGCTGGRHRSVALARWLFDAYSQTFKGATVFHRDKDL